MLQPVMLHNSISVTRDFVITTKVMIRSLKNKLSERLSIHYIAGLLKDARINYER